MNPHHENHNELQNNNLQQNPKDILPKICQNDLDLEQIITAWPDLPEHIKAAIKALVGTHRK